MFYFTVKVHCVYVNMMLLRMGSCSLGLTRMSIELMVIVFLVMRVRLNLSLSQTPWLEGVAHRETDTVR